MENAADALKMAAAVLIFVIALGTAMFGFTKARQAASAVISKSDNTRYYDSENLDIQDSRIVGIETVIPTLYSYFKEGYTVLFYKANWNRTDMIPYNIKKMTLYYTESLQVNLNKSRLQNDEDSSHTVSYKEDDTSSPVVLHRGIYGLDSDDESIRREPWVSDDLAYKNFILALINRRMTPLYEFSREKFFGSPNRDRNDSGTRDNKLGINFQYNFNVTTPLANMTKAHFLERSGIYNANRIKTGDLNDINDISVDMDVYDSRIEFEGDVSVENGTGIQKRVIQYIYLIDF